MNVRFFTNEVVTAAKILKSSPEARTSFKRNVKEIFTDRETQALLFSKLQERIDPLTLEQYTMMAAAYPAVILSDRMISEEGFWKSTMPHTMVPAMLRTMARHPGWTSAYFASCVVVGGLKAYRMKLNQDGQDEFEALTHAQSIEQSERRTLMLREIIAVLREGTEDIRAAGRNFDPDTSDISEILQFLEIQRLTDGYIHRLKEAVIAHDVLAVDDILTDMASEDDPSIVAIAARLDRVWMCSN